MKKYIIAIVTIIVLALVGAAIWYFANNTNQSVSNTSETTNNANNSETKEPESVQDSDNATNNTAPVVISYAEALIKYADRRIQLNTSCQAYPNNVTYKDNTGIMIDNRSPNARTIKVGTTFTIKPWAFKIVVLPDVYLKSKTILVDCDQYQNVATILVQE